VSLLQAEKEAEKLKKLTIKLQRKHSPAVRQ
jgi:hypothetical protein